MQNNSYLLFLYCIIPTIVTQMRVTFVH